MRKKILALSLIGIMVVGNVGVASATVTDTAKSKYNEDGNSETWKNYDSSNAVIDGGTTTNVTNSGTVDGVGGATSKKDVSVSFTDNFQATYSVEIVWEDLVGEANSSTSQWNPNSHSYDDGQSSITVSNNEIFVTNHSDAEVTCTFGFDKDDSLDTNYPSNNINGNVSCGGSNKKSLLSAIGYTDDDNDADDSDGKYKLSDDLKATGVLTLTGSLNKAHTGKVTVGEVTVTLED